MKVRGESPVNELESALGVGGEAQFVPLFIPMRTYRVILEKAGQEGCTAPEVFERALFQYLNKKEEKPEPVPQEPPMITIKRRK